MLLNISNVIFDKKMILKNNESFAVYYDWYDAT